RFAASLPAVTQSASTLANAARRLPELIDSKLLVSQAIERGSLMETSHSWTDLGELGRGSGRIGSAGGGIRRGARPKLAPVGASMSPDDGAVMSGGQLTLLPPVPLTADTIMRREGLEKVASHPAATWQSPAFTLPPADLATLRSAFRTEREERRAALRAMREEAERQMQLERERVEREEAEEERRRKAADELAAAELKRGGSGRLSTVGGLRSLSKNWGSYSRIGSEEAGLGSAPNGMNSPAAPGSPTPSHLSRSSVSRPVSARAQSGEDGGRRLSRAASGGFSQHRLNNSSSASGHQYHRRQSSEGAPHQNVSTHSLPDSPPAHDRRELAGPSPLRKGSGVTDSVDVVALAIEMAQDVDEGAVLRNADKSEVEAESLDKEGDAVDAEGKPEGEEKVEEGAEVSFDAVETYEMAPRKPVPEVETLEGYPASADLIDDNGADTVPVSDDPVPTTDDPVPTTDDPVPTTDDPVPTTDDPVPTNDDSVLAEMHPTQPDGADIESKPNPEVDTADEPVDEPVDDLPETRDEPVDDLPETPDEPVDDLPETADEPVDDPTELDQTHEAAADEAENVGPVLEGGEEAE
ncbi:hypothetical protein BDK51DRAFT_27330, partial [Blyttiomyces helicus]